MNPDHEGEEDVDLDLELVSSFLVLVEEGHFGRAASRLHLNRSGLTKRIQRLERQVGVPLLVRDATGLAGLTAAGSRFVTHAALVLAAARAACAAVSAEPPGRTVTLGIPGRVGTSRNDVC